MFTGLIEEIGRIVKVEIDSKTGQTILTISASVVLKGVALGDSIAVNGVCLTVTSFDHATKQFTVGLSAETLQRTTFDRVKVNDRVNLEKSLTMASHIGGHFVQGHVDGTGVITNRVIDGDCVRITITAPESVVRLIVEKGYIAIDGTSLTVTAVTDSSFSVMLIQYTLKRVILGDKKVGDRVNLEADILGKQIVSYLDKYLANSTIKSKL